ncbi:MAG: BamA/TamA family outer membrane protein [Cyclobacteriaceae bacterium]
MNLAFALEIIRTFLKRVTSYLLAGCAIIALNGCYGTKYLQENQKLLHRQTIVAPKTVNKNTLNDLFVQKPNKKLFGLFNSQAWMYYRGQKHFSKQKFIDKKTKIDSNFTKKIKRATSAKRKDNLLFRKKKKLDALDYKIENGNHFMQWGEAIAVFDSTKMMLSVEKLTNALVIKGFFRASVSATYREVRRKMYVTYQVNPGPPYLLDTLLYEVPDAQVLETILKKPEASLIRIGDQFDQDKITKERERIDYLLKDNGYFDFSRQYIDFQVDTATRKNQKVILKIEIRNPAKHDHHRQFRIDSVIFTPDVNVKPLEKSKRVAVPYENITFNYYQPEYSKKILAQRTFIKQDSLYNRTKTFSTQRQMANLDMFKFVNVNYDTSNGHFIANIFASPLEKYAWSNEAGVTVTQGFPGPYISTNFKKRNFLGGLEILELNGRFGFEGVASATETGNFYKSTEASASVGITFPQFLFPLSHKASFNYAKYNPRTRLLASYTYTDRPEYQRQITTLSASFNWDINQKWQFSFTPTNLNIIQSNTSDEFEALLKDLQNKGNNLINAFNPSFVGSMIFSATWNNNYGSNQKNSTLLRGSIESGGTLLNLYTPQIIINQGLEPYQYIRFNIDFRKNRIINRTTSLAYRINTGFGYAYSKNRVLPYEKNFFAGGSNSVRAWRPRRLGVGSDTPPLSANQSQSGYYDYSFEKPGELLIEGSVEWRQKIFGFVNYALFIDAGNVWSVRSETSAPTQFSLDRFYKEFGIGTGFGLRFDFSFLILRLDVGVKAWDPAKPEGSRFVLGNARFSGPYGIDREPVIYNIGIGYPF